MDIITQVRIKVINNKYNIEICNNGKNDNIINEINIMLKIFTDLFSQGRERVENINNKDYNKHFIELKNNYEIQIIDLKSQIKNFQLNKERDST